MDAHAVLLREFPLQLAHRLYERLGFHVSHGAANLGKDDVILAVLPQERHAALDLIGDVRDNLDGLAQVGALALLGNDGIVYPSGGHIVGLGGMYAKEALVVAQVKVSLRAVFRNIALSVFIRVQRSRVDVYVRVEFLDGDPKPPCLQQFCKRCGNYTFTQGRNHASRDENIL